MGLLDKALRLRKPSEEKAPSGLLAKARKFAEFISPPARQGGPGLLKRALAFKERPGLFQRAKQLRDSLAPDAPDLSGPSMPAASAPSSDFSGAGGHPAAPPSHPAPKPASSTQADRPSGLLHRAENLRSRPDAVREAEHVAEPAAAADALDFSDLPSPASDAGIPASDDLHRPSEEPRGLLHRAESLRTEEPAGSIADDLDFKLDFNEDDFPEALPLPALDEAPDLHREGELGKPDPDLDLDWGTPGELPGFDAMSEAMLAPPEEEPVEESKPELPGLWNELEEPEETDADHLPDFSPGAEAEIEAAEEAALPSQAAMPGGDAADPSDIVSASPEEFWENMDPGDPFTEFEQQAEREAEQALAQRGETGPVEEREKPLFLFDADDEFTTAPVEAHIAGQKKIDHYLSLFDIAREVSAIQDFDEFWDAVLFAVMGQLGAQTVCVFAARSSAESSDGEVFYPVAVSGFNPDESWTLKPGDRLYDLCAAEDGVLYAQNLRSPEQAVLLSETERAILTETAAEIIAPLRNNKRMYGVVLLGSTFSGDEYGIDDLEFITLLGGLASSGVDRILARLEFDRDTESLRKRDFFHNRIMEAARDAAAVRGLDELYDILVRNLTEHFGVDSYSLVLLNPSSQEYTLFAGNRISPESMERFRLSTSSELIGMISNFTRVFDVTDFRTNSEFARSYINDDLGMMKHYWAVPLIYQNWLVGFFTVHSVRRDWTEFDREMVVSLAELLGPSFGGAIMLGERESLFRDPFSPLEDRLRLELKKCQEFHSHLSLVEIRIKNIKRVLALNPSARVTQFLGAVGRSVAGHLLQTDFLARIGQGRFAMILPGRGKEEAEIFIKKVRNDLKRLNLLPGSPVDAQFVHTIVSAQDTTDPEKMLAILE